MKKYNLAVVIGEFSPVTKSSTAVIKDMLDIADEVLVIIEKSYQPRSIALPFNEVQREDMIKESLPDDIVDKVTCVYLGSSIYSNNVNLFQIQSLVDYHLCYTSHGRNIVITNLGYNDDYNALTFPQWDFIENVSSIDDEEYVRDTYLHSGVDSELVDSGVVHSRVLKTMYEFEDTRDYLDLTEEYYQIQQYTRSWNAAPFPPTFVTVDAVVIKSGHVLMIRRKNSPGKCLWALPGGFLDQYEDLTTAVLRELNEEACLKVSKNDIVSSRVFADPYRSVRGRTITHAFLIDLGVGTLPPVYPADDAMGAKWLSIYEVFNMRNSLFEDHNEIISWGINHVR